MLKEWKNDVSVLLIFFVRDEVFAKTFEAVRKARPRRLLLYQDGPREGRSDDLVGIQKCREIAENIDWECEVHKNYQMKNWGCDPATFYSHKWAFSIVDKCIILEDDCVPSQSFFPYCKELLDKYEFDERINRICGMNNIGVSEDCPYSYFFSNVGSVWGWATWKRVANTWDEGYTFLNDKYHMDALALINNHKDYGNFLKTSIRHSSSGKPHWETIVSFNSLLNSTLNIIPKENMISNIGITENATHALSDIRVVPKELRKIFYMKTYEIVFPLKHPQYIVNNLKYVNLLSKQFGKNNQFSKIQRIFETVFLRLKYVDFKTNIKSLMKKIKLK